MPARISCLKVPIGGGYDPDIDLSGSGAADRHEFSFLQDPQQFGLDDGRQFADLVKEGRAAVGQLKQTVLVGNGAGEGSLDMAEQFAFQQAFPEWRCR